MPKVLLSLSNFYPKLGGVERYAEELFSRLAQERGYEVSVVCHDNTVAPRHERYHGIDIYRIHSSWSFGQVFSLPVGREWRRFVLEIAEPGGFDFVSTQTRFFFTSYLGLRLARSLGIPLIHTEHGGGFVRHQSKIVELGARFYDETLGRAVLRQANGITAVSKQVARFVQQFSGRQAEIVHNGIDMDYWDPAKTRSLPKDLESWIGGRIPLLFMGRLMEAKGWRILLDSLNALSEEDLRQCAILIAGTGPDEHHLKEEIVARHLSSQIRLLGRQAPESIRDILSVASYLNPSYSGEGLQTTLLEAAAMNSFILTTNVSGAEEVVTGLSVGQLVAQRNVQDFAKSLQTLLYKRPKASGRSVIAKSFAWEIIVSQYDTYVKSILDSHI